MDPPDPAARRRLRLQAAAGVLLTLVGASVLLWLVFDDRLPTTTPTPDPDSLTLWAIGRTAAGIALAAGTWLLAVAVVSRRRQD